MSPKGKTIKSPQRNNYCQHLLLILNIRPKKRGENVYYYKITILYQASAFPLKLNKITNA